MNETAIKTLLNQLHSTLDGTSAITEKDRELLAQVSADIRALLAQPGVPTAAKHQTTIDRLQTAITRFEVSHPDLTATMANMIKRLADMGI